MRVCSLLPSSFSRDDRPSSTSLGLERVRESEEKRSKAMNERTRMRIFVWCVNPKRVRVRSRV